MQVFPASQKPHLASQKPPQIKFASLAERLRAIFKSDVAASAFEFNALALDSDLGICRLCTPAGTFTALTAQLDAQLRRNRRPASVFSRWCKPTHGTRSTSSNRQKSVATAAIPILRKAFAG